MKRKQVQSSSINSIGYNFELQVLEVEFKGGAVYYYKEVPAMEVLKLFLDDSTGKYFAANIKNKYVCTKGEYNV